ncbi:porin [Tropicimonas sp. S265A]|uniref:porin n=1 Tax=Tropicimonas sp. S265A TaxID=3415134 RepID=UPI003C7C47ED
MKKLLIASTALVATSGFAYADVTLSGSAQFGVIYQEDRTVTDGNGDAVDDELFLDYELQFDLAGSTTTDSGLTFGASADFENDSNATADSNDQGFDPEIFVSGGFGTLTIGDVDVATDTAFGGKTRDPGYDGIGIDNKIDSLIFADADAGFDTGDEIDSNIMYELAVAGFELTVTADSFEENYAVALGYDFGSFDVGIGYVEIEDYQDNVNSDGLSLIGGGESISLFFGGELAGFDFDIYYAEHENEPTDLDLNGYGVSASYDLGGYTLSFAANYTEVEDTNIDGWDYGIGVNYDLGGGASLDAGIGQVYTIDFANNDTDDQLVASLGMSFKF